MTGAAGASGAAGAAAFAREVRARYAGGRRAGWPPMRIVLASLVPRRAAAAGAHFLYAPRFDFRILAPAPSPAASVSGAASTPAPAGAPRLAPALPVALQPRAPHVAAPRAATIGRTLQGRGRRVDGARPASPADAASRPPVAARADAAPPARSARRDAAPAPHPASEPPAPAAVRLVPRRAARRAEPAEPPDEPETKLVERRAMERAWGEGARRAGAAAPSVPPVDLDRLTDQVVRALDRRLVAQRERQGRR